MSSLLKKCTAMYTIVFRSLNVRNDLKRGKRQQVFFIYQWNHIQIYSNDVSSDVSSHSTNDRKGGRKKTDGNTCVCMCVCTHSYSCMNSASAEPNVRPIQVYWDQVVLVSQKVKADLYNQTWGWVWWYWWQWWASGVVGVSTPPLLDDGGGGGGGFGDWWP